MDHHRLQDFLWIAMSYGTVVLLVLLAFISISLMAK